VYKVHDLKGDVISRVNDMCPLVLKHESAIKGIDFPTALNQVNVHVLWGPSI